MFDLEGKRVWVAGHRGLAGSALVRRLESEPIGELITATSHELDLRRQRETEEFVFDRRPQVVLLAAARVGGIDANRSAQAQFLFDNVMIAANVIEASRQSGVEKLVGLGSACIYPREVAQPIHEDAIMSGPLEPTNEGYAVAKITQLMLAKMYRRQYGMNAIALMPTNLYGPGDNFDLESSHVLAALMRKIHETHMSGSPSVEIWGTGTASRDFLHADDLADATIFALRSYEEELHLNVGCGKDITIRELAELIADVVGWHGEFVFNRGMPDGTPRRLLDVRKLSELGWKPRIGLREGIEATYSWFAERHGTSAYRGS